MNGSDHRRFNQLGIGEWQKVEMVMDNVEIAGMFHQITDVQAL